MALRGGAWQDKRGPDKTRAGLTRQELGLLGQELAWQDKNWPDRTRAGQTGQELARQDKELAWQDKSWPDRAATRCARVRNSSPVGQDGTANSMPDPSDLQKLCLWRGSNSFSAMGEAGLDLTIATVGLQKTQQGPLRRTIVNKTNQSPSPRDSYRTISSKYSWTGHLCNMGHVYLADWIHDS
jgi:hypothetical protein